MSGTTIALYRGMESAFVEQRKHKRYAPFDDAVTVFDTKVGRVINISEGGMAVKWIGDVYSSGDNTITFLCNSKQLLIADLPVRFLSVRNEQASLMGTINLQSTRLGFNYADSTQHNQIKKYISWLARNEHQDLKDN
jgi:hypothetical protein